MRSTTLTRWTLRAATVVVLALGAAVSAPHARGSDGDGGGRVRVAGSCGAGATARLELRAEDEGRLEVRFRLSHGRGASRWRVALVHERRVVWTKAVRASGSGGSLEVRRVLPDLSGADVVTARAWGPRGLTCRASATLHES